MCNVGFRLLASNDLVDEWKSSRILENTKNNPRKGRVVATVLLSQVLLSSVAAVGTGGREMHSGESGEQQLQTCPLVNNFPAFLILEITHTAEFRI